VELTMFEEQVWVPKHSDGSIDEVVQTDEDYFEGKAMSPRRRSAVSRSVKARGLG